MNRIEVHKCQITDLFIISAINHLSGFSEKDCSKYICLLVLFVVSYYSYWLCATRDLYNKTLYCSYHSWFLLALKNGENLEKRESIFQ